MDIKVTMSLKEWEEQKAVEREAGRIVGHQGALRFISELVNYPHREYACGKDFPKDLKESLNKIIREIREKIKVR